jgi:hypothetical protein
VLHAMDVRVCLFVCLFAAAPMLAGQARSLCTLARRVCRLNGVGLEGVATPHSVAWGPHPVWFPAA